MGQCTMKSMITLATAVGITSACGLEKDLGFSPPGGTAAWFAYVAVRRVDNPGPGYEIEFALEDRDLESTVATGVVRIVMANSIPKVVCYESYPMAKKDFSRRYISNISGTKGWQWYSSVFIAAANVSIYGSGEQGTAAVSFVKTDGTVVDDGYSQRPIVF